MLRHLAVVGGGPAGLMAAETAAAAGLAVDVYDAMASVGRKILIAGKGGLNLTHAEPLERFLDRYGARRPQIAPLVAAFGPDDLRAWARGLGIETFIGSSGRVFPSDMKAAPLLRAWLRQLKQSGVRFHLRHRWRGWDSEGALSFGTPDGHVAVHADAAVLALGGGSWPKLGSDGAWVPLLRAKGVCVAALRPANCGFDVDWSEHFRVRFAGQPVKPVAIAMACGEPRPGELVVTETGVEGSLIYALSAPFRDAIETQGCTTVFLDLAPDRSRERLAADLAKPRGRLSMANHLQRRAGIDGVKIGLLRECAADAFADPSRLAAAIKSLPLRLQAPRPLDEAISSAGGIAFEALDEHLMLRNIPGVFCAGEMLDWEAPTGGYLFTACFASGRVAGAGAAAWLAGTKQAENA